MADALPTRLEGFDEAATKLADAPSAVQQAVRDAVEASAALVLAGAKAKVSDQILHVKTGRLRRSLQYTMGGTAEAPSAQVGTNVEYAAIHEFGGTTRAHVIEALNAKALMFEPKAGGLLFRRRVQHPGSKIPERSYLRSTLAEQSERIRQRIDAALAGALP